MSKMFYGTDVFESGCEMLDVTSNSRPDTSWRHTDSHGHVHQWYSEGKPATDYNPQAAHTTPTLIFIVDDVGYFEDGETYDIGHYECGDCHESVPSPQTCADLDTVYMAGPRWYTINGQSVSPDEFKRRYEAARGSRT